MSDSYQSIRLGGENNNAESLGDFVAWLITNNLLDQTLQDSAGSQIARVKMQDLTGAAFLTTVLHGELKPEHISREGRKFCEHYLASGDYDRDYQGLDFHNFKYKDENEWLRYDAIAPRISEVYRLLNAPKSAVINKIANVLQFPKRK
jgi:hypothetical protein